MLKANDRRARPLSKEICSGGSRQRHRDTKASRWYPGPALISDEAVCERWLENPYWQFFTGEVVFQTRLPCDASSLTRWRQRLGEAGMEELLAHTINTAHAMKAVDASQFMRMRCMLRRQRTVLGRLVRDIQRKLDQVNTGVRERIAVWLERAQQVHAPRPKHKRKIDALQHAPKVDCIGKGKARQPYAFGVKVKIAVSACKALDRGSAQFSGQPV